MVGELEARGTEKRYATYKVVDHCASGHRIGLRLGPYAEPVDQSRAVGQAEGVVRAAATAAGEVTHDA